MYIESSRTSRRPAQAQPAPAAAEARPESPQPGAVPAPACELSGSFQNNIYPSLMLSFGVSYPEYSRCLTVSLHDLPASG